MTEHQEVKEAVLSEIKSAASLKELEALQKANGSRQDVADDAEVAAAAEIKKGEIMEEASKITKDQLAAQLQALTELVTKLSKPKARTVRPASGRKIFVRKGVELPKGVTTPQVRQLAAAFQALGREEMSEAEVFEMVEDAKAKGIMRTTQSAVRIYRYYREPLFAAGMIEQEG